MQMDIKDLVITAEETLDDAAKRVEAQALDSVYAFYEEGGLEVQFGQDRVYKANIESESGHIVLHTGERYFTFYYDDIMEAWYEKELEQRFLPVLEKLINRQTGASIQLDTDD
ncbi:MAG: hypothetical protein CL946_12190 [Ectothiorhodospiraceae bacterium]|nr:hypothetical protein [Ectothiorhodospiraceae bacterium]